MAPLNSENTTGDASKCDASLMRPHLSHQTDEASIIKQRHNDLPSKSRPEDNLPGIQSGPDNNSIILLASTTIKIKISLSTNISPATAVKASFMMEHFENSFMYPYSKHNGYIPLETPKVNNPPQEDRLSVCQPPKSWLGYTNKGVSTEFETELRCNGSQWSVEEHTESEVANQFTIDRNEDNHVGIGGQFETYVNM